ncbi:MAG: hypothetical protein AAGA27_03160, partial [Pseudomonadota bacterium]
IIFFKEGVKLEMFSSLIKFVSSTFKRVFALIKGNKKKVFTLKANLLKTSNPVQLETSQFVDFPTQTTPGNVGICLSGGGSRALVAGMGQLRGLITLKNDKGNLLSQTRSISTVSGGSWVGATFVYLPNQYSDEDYLGSYISPSSYTIDSIKTVSSNTIGSQVTSGISPVSISLQAVLLLILGIPKHNIWKTIIANNFLKPYGLYQIDPIKKQASKSIFSYNKQTLSDIVSRNPQLENTTAHLVNSNTNASRRPYLICNSSMFVNQPKDDFQYLVPVQNTPFYTGVFSHPDTVTDNNGHLVGGGGVESFAFSSDLDTIDNNQVTISQQQTFSLADAISTSSAFYAQILQDFGAKWHADFDTFLSDTAPFIEEALKVIDDFVTDHSISNRIIKEIINKKELPTLNDDHTKVLSALADLKTIVPEYQYWSVNGPVTPDVKPTPFADGGDLENTGIAASLLYKDIERLIAFVNSTALTQGQYGVLDQNNELISGTQIIVGFEIPPLFGYKPYDSKMGYQLYRNANTSKYEIYKNNQIFPSEAFVELIKGLWETSGNLDKPGSNQYAANYMQSLTTVDNQWFGIKGGRQINILWVYNNLINDWYNQLSPDIKTQLFNNDPSSYNNFPNYNLFDTQLTPEQINLLSGQTAWNIVEGNPKLFLSMYEES